MTALDERPAEVERTDVDDLVDAAMPEGQTIQLPMEWVDRLSDLTQQYESPSSIRTFLGCPLRWYMERYSDLPDGPPGFAGTVGTFVHRVLEVFYSEPSHLRTPQLLSKTFHTAWSALKQRSASGIIPQDLQEEFDYLQEESDDDDRMRGGFYKKAKDCVMSILEFDDSPDGVEVLGTETWVGIERNGIIVRGKVDRIVSAPSGSEICQDFKTGRAPSEDEPIDVLEDSYVPVGLYALMRSSGGSPIDGFPGKTVSRIQLLFLGRELRKYNIKVKPVVLEKASKLLDRVTERMADVARTGEITMQPADSPDEGQCTYCPVKDSCPAWTGEGIDRLRQEQGI